MKKYLKFLIINFIILSLLGCKNYDYKEKLKNFNLYIDKINLDIKYNIKSITDDVYGVVMFEECGRPDINGSNTVIGAHSGIGENAYFNEINKLDKGDKILITYDNKEYIYIVNEVKEVDDTMISVLDDIDRSILTLLTCKLGDSSKRIIVVCDLNNGKN